MFFSLAILSGLLCFGGTSLRATEADKTYTLTELIAEALKNNLEISEAASKINYIGALSSKSKAPFYPEFGLESGWEDLRGKKDKEGGGFSYAYAKYNLFNGGRDQLESNIRSKEHEFAKLAHESLKAKLSRFVATQFYKILFVNEAIALKKEEISLNTEQKKKAEKRVRGGITSRADILEFEFKGAALESDLVLLNQEYESVQRELRRLLGRTSENLMAVKGSLQEDLSKIDEPKLADSQIFSSLELKESEKDLEVSHLQYKSSLKQWYPAVDLQADYGFLKPSERQELGTPASAVLLKVSVPLFSGFDSYHDKMAKISAREQKELHLARLRAETKAQVETILSRLNALSSRIALEQKNAIRANDYFNLTTQEYNRGVKNSPDYASAAGRLFETKLRVLELQKDLQLTRISLSEFVGSKFKFKE